MALSTSNTVPAAQQALSSKLNFIPISLGGTNNTSTAQTLPGQTSGTSQFGVGPSALPGASNFKTPNFETVTGQKQYVAPPTSNPTTTNALTNLGRTASPVAPSAQPQVPGAASVQPTTSASYTNPNYAMQTEGFQNAPAGTPAPAAQTEQKPSMLNSLISQLVGLATSGKNAIYNTNQQITGLKTDLASKTGDLANEGGVLNYQTGRIGALQNQEAVKESALQGQLTNELAANAQGIQGLSSAAGLATPANQNYNVSPGNKTYDSSGNLIASGPQLGSIGSQQYYDPANPGATSGNTPFTAGEVAGNQSLGAQYAQNVSANNQAKAVKAQIDSYLTSNPNLNPSALSDVNSVIQLLSGKVSNPAYQTLSNYLSEYVNTLAPILGVGGDTTNLKTQIAQGFINAKASGQSIGAVLDGIEALAEAKLSAQKGGSNGSSGSSTGGSVGWF